MVALRIYQTVTHKLKKANAQKAHLFFVDTIAIAEKTKELFLPTHEKLDKCDKSHISSQKPIVYLR